MAEAKCVLESNREASQQKLREETEELFDEPEPVVTEAPMGKRPRRRAPKEDSAPSASPIQEYLRAKRERDAAAPAAPDPQSVRIRRVGGPISDS